MRRRDFIAGLGSVAAWPVGARAQQPERMRLIGVLLGFDENDPPVWKPQLSVFTQALANLGWADGRNVRMDFRWGGGGIGDQKLSPDTYTGPHGEFKCPLQHERTRGLSVDHTPECYRQRRKSEWENFHLSPPSRA
jgi:hypothetical protein